MLSCLLSQNCGMSQNGDRARLYSNRRNVLLDCKKVYSSVTLRILVRASFGINLDNYYEGIIVIEKQILPSASNP